MTAFCGALAAAAELHDRTELDWIREESCMECWRLIAAGLRGGTVPWSGS
ncbi:hypothetical protein [Saccharopolyspora cebuensis]|uniref:Uncharacterized protein n=1 Tax=Saccharopolyspora cebuensis TaxID=418759 RepID=A0ABV4CLI9_9PSEU